MHLTKLGMFVQPFAQVLSIVTFGRVNNVSTFMVQVGTIYLLFVLNLDMTRCLRQSIIFISFSHEWETIVFVAMGVVLLQAISSNLFHS
jgi:energy-converting hydrogenase Eha subunit E